MKKVIAVVLFLLISVGFPSAALAADPVPDNLLVSLWPEYSDNQVFFMQQIDLPASTTLPATIRFSFPSGVQIRWTGEILGSDVSKDITATPVTTPKDGYDEVAITLTKSHTGQAEAIWDGLKIEGNKHSIALKWIQRYAATTTTFEFLEPSKSSNIIMTPVVMSTRTSPDGFIFHLTSPKVLAVGQAEDFNVSYTRTVTTPSINDAKASANTAGQPTETASGTATGTAKTPVSTWVILSIFLITGILVTVLIIRENNKRQ